MLVLLHLNHFFIELYRQEDVNLSPRVHPNATHISIATHSVWGTFLQARRC